MSDTEKPTENPENELPESDEAAELAEIIDLADLEDLDDDYAPSPRLKEYLQSSDSPSRYLMILSICFGFLAFACISLLIFQYVRHRHHEQKPPISVVETVKIEPTYHEALGQYKIDWDDAEMRADLVAECTTKEACDQLKDLDTEARDLVLPILQESSRSAVLNPTQKQYLRQKIAEKLNELKLHGKIVQVDFFDLTIEPRKN